MLRATFGAPYGRVLCLVPHPVERNAFASQDRCPGHAVGVRPSEPAEGPLDIGVGGWESWRSGEEEQPNGEGPAGAAGASYTARRGVAPAPGFSEPCTRQILSARTLDLTR